MMQGLHPPDGGLHFWWRMTTPIDQADIVIIGGGVVGCAIFRRLALLGLKPLMLEAGGDILSGASKANSEIRGTITSSAR